MLLAAVRHRSVEALRQLKQVPPSPLAAWQRGACVPACERASGNRQCCTRAPVCAPRPHLNFSPHAEIIAHSHTYEQALRLSPCYGWNRLV
eukprot:6181496-Pleurochrysis_carterae.AAC.1